MLIFALLRDMREKGMNQTQMICVGYSRAAEEYIDRVLANPQWGYVIRESWMIMFRQGLPTGDQGAGKNRKSECDSSGESPG